MITLKTITIRQYVELEDKSEYDFAMKYAFRFTEPKDEYGIGDIMELPFGFIKDFQYELEQGLKIEWLFDTVTDLIYKTRPKGFKKLSWYIKKKLGFNFIGAEPLDKFMRFVNYLKESMKELIEAENIALAYEPTEKELNAGIERFNGLGVYIQIRSLTKGDLTKHEQIRALPYSLCFTELYTSKQLADYEKDITKLSQNNY